MTVNDGYDGYSPPQQPGTQPAPGAPTEGAPPTPGTPAPSPEQAGGHEPPPDSPRFKEVYRNWKETERQLAEMKAQLEDRLASPPQQRYEQQTEYEEAAGSSDDDPWGELRSVIGSEVQKHLTPLQQQFIQQQQQTTAQQNYQKFLNQHPEFKLETDGVRVKQVLDTYAQRGVPLPLDAAYDLAFPDRAAARLYPAPTTPQAPVANVGGPTYAAPAESPEAIWAQMEQETNPGKKDDLFQRWIAAGGGGVNKAAGNLGWG